MARGGNPYRALQVDPSAEPEVIEAAYRRLARKYHPDVNPDPEAAARMRDLSAAYAVLRDPASRTELDRRRSIWRPVWFVRSWWPRWARPPWGRGPVVRSPAPVDDSLNEPEAVAAGRPPCSRHGSRPAVGACRACGSSLCSSCASLFEPAGCAPCVRRQARRAQLRAVAGLGSFVIPFGLVLNVACSLVRASIGTGLLVAYLVAATVLGVAVMTGRMWWVSWPDEPGEGGLGVTFLVWLGLVIGWVGAPVLLVRMGRNLVQGRRLAALAGAVLEMTPRA